MIITKAKPGSLRWHLETGLIAIAVVGIAVFIGWFISRMI